MTKVQAIAIRNGKIVTVGSDSDILHLAGSKQDKLTSTSDVVTKSFISFDFS